MDKDRGAAAARLAEAAEAAAPEAREVDAMGFPIDGYDYSRHMATVGGGRFIRPDGSSQPSAGDAAAGASAAAAMGAVAEDADEGAESEEEEEEEEGAVVMPGEGMRAQRMLESVTLEVDKLDDDMIAAMQAAEDEAETDDEGDDDEDGEGGRAWGGGVDGFEELNDDFVVMAAGIAPVGAGWEAQVAVGDDGRLADEADASNGFDFDAHLKRLIAQANRADGDEDGEEDDEDDEDEELGGEGGRRVRFGEGAEEGGVAASGLPRITDLRDEVDVVLAQFGDEYLGDPGEDAEAEEELRILQAAATSDERRRQLAALGGEMEMDDEEDEEEDEEDEDDLGSLAGPTRRQGAGSVARGSALGGRSVAESMAQVAIEAAERIAERIDSARVAVRIPALNAAAEHEELSRDPRIPDAPGVRRGGRRRRRLRMTAESIAAEQLPVGEDAAAADGATGGASEHKEPDSEGEEEGSEEEGSEEEEEEEEHSVDVAALLAATAGRAAGEDDGEEEGFFTVDDIPVLRDATAADGTVVRASVADVMPRRHQLLGEGHTVSLEAARKVREATLRLAERAAQRDAAEEASAIAARERVDARRKRAAEAAEAAETSTLAFKVNVPGAAKGEAAVPTAGDREMRRHMAPLLGRRRLDGDCATVLTGLSTTSHRPTVIDDRRPGKARGRRGGGPAVVDAEPVTGTIKLSSRLGIPVPESRGTAVDAAVAEEDGEDGEEDDEEDEDGEAVDIAALEEAAAAPRERGEGKEARKARKEAAKALRRVRREARKDMKEAFKHERSRQAATAAGGKKGGALGVSSGTVVPL